MDTHNLVSRSTFGTPGMLVFALLCARLARKAQDGGWFYISQKLIKQDGRHSRASVYHYLEAFLFTGLLLSNGKSGRARRFRFNLALLQKLCERTVRFESCVAAVRDRKGNIKHVDGAQKMKRAWCLVECTPKSDDPERVQKADHLIECAPAFGQDPSDIQTLIEVDNNNYKTTSPRLAARESQQARENWGKWNKVQDVVRILEADPETSHVAAFIQRVRTRLPPPPHFTADLFDEWVDALKTFPRDVLMRLADQQRRERREWVDSLQVLVRLAAQLMSAEPTASVVHTDEPKVPNVREYPVAADVPPELRELDRAVWEELKWFPHSLFRQLRFEGVAGGVATFSGNGFAIDQLDKNHRATFEDLIRRCIPNARHVDFRRDRKCQ